MKILDKFDLPKEFEEVSPTLLAQSVRVHLANLRQGTQSALTRAEVSKTRKKYQKQKGSGNARHGDRKAPIFVGGGVSFAPKPRDHSLAMSDKMRKQAIFGAFFAKHKAKELFVASGMDKATGKTKEIAELIDARKTLIITDSQRENVYRAARNISGVVVLPMNQVSTYEILRANKVIIMEESFKERGIAKPESPKKSKVKEPAVKKTTIKKKA